MMMMILCCRKKNQHGSINECWILDSCFFEKEKKTKNNVLFFRKENKTKTKPLLISGEAEIDRKMVMKAIVAKRKIWLFIICVCKRIFNISLAFRY